MGTCVVGHGHQIIKAPRPRRTLPAAACPWCRQTLPVPGHGGSALSHSTGRLSAGRGRQTAAAPGSLPSARISFQKHEDESDAWLHRQVRAPRSPRPPHLPRPRRSPRPPPEPPELAPDPTRSGLWGSRSRGVAAPRPAGGRGARGRRSGNHRSRERLCRETSAPSWVEGQGEQEHRGRPLEDS